MNTHHKCSWTCSCWHVFGILLWIAALIALVYAWVATMNGSILGQRPNFWFANAMILGILAMPLKLRRGCTCEGCEGGICSPKK